MSEKWSGYYDVSSRFDDDSMWGYFLERFGLEHQLWIILWWFRWLRLCLSYQNDYERDRFSRADSTLLWESVGNLVQKGAANYPWMKIPMDYRQNLGRREGLNVLASCIRLSAWNMKVWKDWRANRRPKCDSPSCYGVRIVRTEDWEAIKLSKYKSSGFENTRFGTLKYFPTPRLNAEYMFHYTTPTKSHAVAVAPMVSTSDLVAVSQRSWSGEEVLEADTSYHGLSPTISQR